MESLWENKAMLYSILFSGVAVFTLASGHSQDLMNQFELVLLPTEVFHSIFSPNSILDSKLLGNEHIVRSCWMLSGG